MEYAFFGVAVALALFGILFIGIGAVMIIRGEESEVDWLDTANSALVFAVTGGAIGYIIQFFMPYGG